jgi:uncharacterized membrane protein YgdD (TMEM256/DUF423 family)
MNWSVVGAILMALGVGLGAFGAHDLRGRLDEYLMGVYEKAVFYHFVHAVGMLIAARFPLVCWLLLTGILFFSGSLYLLAVTGNRMMGAITPIGGVCFIAAWLVLAWRFASTAK